MRTAVLRWKVSQSCASTCGTRTRAHVGRAFRVFSTDEPRKNASAESDEGDEPPQSVGTNADGGPETRKDDARSADPAQDSTSSSADAPRWSRYSHVLTEDPQRKALIDRMIRVDHAGETGAAQIYAGQLAVFRGTSVGNVIQEMRDQEQKHLDEFDRLVVERRVRPTVLMPLWNVAGYALGLGTALLSKEAAMACTVAVEEVISDHYNDQVRHLLEPGFEDESDLRATFREFRDDELEHKHTGLEHDAQLAPMYRAMTEIIKAGCRTAIFASERV